MRKSIWLTTMLVLALAACSDGGSGGKADSGTDTDVDSDTDTYENPCGEGEHAGCYGNEVWCMDDSDTPLSQLDVCDGGEQCVELSEVYAECQCVDNSYQDCHNGDVWAYDSCGEFDELVLECESPAECVSVGEGEADCCQLDAFQACNTDGDVHSYDACEFGGDIEGDLIDACPENSDCVEPTDITAECQCHYHWAGDNCDECPPHWDPDQDCNACLGYWEGADCDVCGGFGSDSDHCQCPSSQYVPQPNSHRCWTCPSPFNAVSGTCINETGWEEMTWDEALASCPDEFTLPTEVELLALYSNCEEFSWGVDCDSCTASEICNSMFGEVQPDYIWTSETCSTGHEWFYFQDGEYLETACNGAPSTEPRVCIR